VKKPFLEAENIYPNHRADTNFMIIAIASSAGGLKALSQVVFALPRKYSYTYYYRTIS
jgi:two-component system, chemotaxis family, protein-glutamate methylesterase/glutaminase